MNAWKLEAGRHITTPDGTFYLTYGRTTDGSNAPRFRDPAELDRIARQVAALPELLAALQDLVIQSEDYVLSNGKRKVDREQFAATVREARAAMEAAK